MDESAIWSAQNLGLEEAARTMQRMYGVVVRVAIGAVKPKAKAETRFGVFVLASFQDSNYRRFRRVRDAEHGILRGGI